MEYTEKTNYSFETKRRIVICGSMGAYSQMLEVQHLLFSNNVRAIVPEAEDHIKPTLTPEDFSAFKRKVSHAYLRKIKDPRTFGILVVNPDKYKIPNYIGPNSFAEIAVAFAQSKKIFILNGIPDVYEDEINSWGGVCLNGVLDLLVENYHQAIQKDQTQLQLF